ncbi:MAG: response regulator [Deltaproteobacteria bacterium]|nr:response regulator [Deltaproteobacteria bacterium]
MENRPGFTILIADRNPNVRDLLKRELVSDGYRVIPAKNSREILKQVFSQTPLDLLILDPDLANVGDTAIFEKLNNRIPQLPLVVHSFQTDHSQYPLDVKNVIFVEKRGNSIEHLKRVVAKILNRNRKEPCD